MTLLTVAIIGFLALALYTFWDAVADKRQREKDRGWRIRRTNTPGSWAYEELSHGVWNGFVMEETTDYREPPHHLQIMGAARWNEYPAPMQGRRDEILKRIRSELREPDYFLIED